MRGSILTGCCYHGLATIDFRTAVSSVLFAGPRPSLIPMRIEPHLPSSTGRAWGLFSAARWPVGRRPATGFAWTPPFG